MSYTPVSQPFFILPTTHVSLIAAQIVGD